MAYYKYPAYLTQFNDSMFDALHTPGQQVVYSGIYLCEGCGKEISHNSSVSLPPQNHHQHTIAQGSIRWRLIVWAATA
jgi:hypothetical protein